MHGTSILLSLHNERILESDPGHPDVLHLSGVIAHHSGKSDTAIDLISRAIQIDPEQLL